MPVTLTLEDDEALVLLDLLVSKNFATAAGTSERSVLSAFIETAVGIPERNALWALECLLERQLAAPFSPDCDKLLDAARQSLVDRYGA